MSLCVSKPPFLVTLEKKKQTKTNKAKGEETKMNYRGENELNSSFKGLLYSIKESQAQKDTVLDSLCAAVTEQRQNGSGKV